jgi:sec-independent protein translocase protein TatA
MGVGGIGIWQLLIILLIVVLLFGTKRLKSIGSDLGNAVKGFRSAMTDSDKNADGDEEPKRLDAAHSEQDSGPDSGPASTQGSSSGSDSVRGSAGAEAGKPAEKTKV